MAINIIDDVICYSFITIIGVMFNARLSKRTTLTFLEKNVYIKNAWIHDFLHLRIFYIDILELLILLKLSQYFLIQHPYLVHNKLYINFAKELYHSDSNL